MLIETIRYSTTEESSLGLFMIEGVFYGYTLEDTERAIKVAGETRIHEGIYQVGLRTEGGMHERYLQKFGPQSHKGMLWIKDVPEFEYVYIHYGNFSKDTAGCILVGTTPNNNQVEGRGAVYKSIDMYKSIYSLIATRIIIGEPVQIRVWSIA